MKMASGLYCTHINRLRRITMTNNEMINRFKDMADLAEASYAELHYVIENIDSVFESRGGGGDIV